MCESDTDSDESSYCPPEKIPKKIKTLNEDLCASLDRRKFTDEKAFFVVGSCVKAMISEFNLHKNAILSKKFCLYFGLEL